MNTVNIFQAAAEHIAAVRLLAKNNQIVWTEDDLSQVEQSKIANPERSMRAFSGTGGSYTINVMQGNTSDRGLVCLGVITCPHAPQMVNLPVDVASELYRRAATSRN
jgi:hypothetical protein